MIVRKIVSGVVAVVALATAASVTVVAAAFAVFTLLQTYVGPSGAAAIIAAALAVLLSGAAIFLLGRSKSKPAAVTVPLAEPSLPQRLFYMLQERPVVAAGAAVATGLIAWRNPRLASLVTSLFALGRQRA
ncbi:MAG: hypothetical protein ACYDD1_05925 [Caulobacteraceae bacterium]